MRPGDTDELARQAQDFALDLTQTVRLVAGEATAPFHAVVAEGQEGKPSRIVISQRPSTGIALEVDGQPLLKLVVEYRCAWDHAQRYLAVDFSSVKVYRAGDGEPLFRYEYVREQIGGLPSAHVQVHGHRDALTYVMTMCGKGSRRGRGRAKKVDRGVLPRMQDLHFPLGGSRYRPCLEDVMQMLVTEIGVDAPAGALQALAEGREGWRLNQLAAAVRDSPETAARVLREELDYQVTPPAAGPLPNRQDRLREL